MISRKHSLRNSFCVACGTIAKLNMCMSGKNLTIASLPILRNPAALARNDRDRSHAVNRLPQRVLPIIYE